MLKKIKNQIGNFHLFRRYPSAKQFLKFCLVGLTNFVVDFAVYFLLTRWLRFYYLIAAVVSFTVAVSWSFYFNRRWTFRHHQPDLAKQYSKFFTVNVLVLALNLSLLYFFVDFLRWHDLLAKILVSAILALVNFTLNRFWTFRRAEI